MPPPMADRDGTPAPVFIVAPMGRSGTNFLKAVLSTHPDLYLADVLEDYLTAGAGKLQDYVDGVFTSWERIDTNNYQGPGKVGPDDMLAAIGTALLTFVGADKDPTRRPLMKTPAIGDLDVGLRVFPKANYLLLIRDPRSIAESFLHVQSDWNLSLTLEQLASNWAEHMRAVSRILADNQTAVREGRIVTIRYEKLVSDPAAVANTALQRIGIRPFPDGTAPATDFPVVGSSFGPRKADGKVDFSPKPKPEDFDPTQRWATWAPDRHHRFNRICGALMKRWGYEPVS